MSSPAWAKGFFWAQIYAAAGRHGLDPLLVGAIVRQESAGHQYATRFEKAWGAIVTPEHFAVELGLSLDTEIIAQKHSYGLMQIMGATARGLGYTGFCAALVEVEAGLEWGCRYLARQGDRFKEMPALVASYNAGTPRYTDDGAHFVNQAYCDSVLRWYEQLKAGGIDPSNAVA